MKLGYGPSRVSTARPPISVPEALRRNAFHPGSPPVTVHETHTAWVFLAGDHAYKVKKPVRMDFLDFGTLERRRAVCLEEIRLNHELAPTLGMRLRAVVPLADSYVLMEPDAAGAVEYAIEMRRFDEQRTMAALAGRGELADEQVRAVAARVAAFHAAAPVRTPDDAVGDVKDACDHNARELYALVDDAAARRVLAIERFTGAFLVNHRAEIAARGAAGQVRDGHGDLRAEHVVLEDPITIIDRLEFDARLRTIDVAEDLAFLATDLERLGASHAARVLVTSYRDAGGDPGSDALLAFYGAYRALVRTKVALLRAAQLDDPAAAAAAREQAADQLALAERIAWRARGPLVLAVAGPPASGKSTLAHALSHHSGWPILSSDVLRKRWRGLDLGAKAPHGDYTLDARTIVYRDLGDRARAAVMAGQGIVIDATFGEPRLRAAFLDALAERQPLRALECRTPAATRERWVREREPAGAHGSDADPTVAARLGERYSGWDELPQDTILGLRPGGDTEPLVDQVADWLDTRASVVCRAAARPATEEARTAGD
jgi:aminoglycoside phosphotransferase family enzyme/predicted kinase